MFDGQDGWEGKNWGQNDQGQKNEDKMIEGKMIDDKVIRDKIIGGKIIKDKMMKSRMIEGKMMKSGRFAWLCFYLAGSRAAETGLDSQCRPLLCMVLMFFDGKIRLSESIVL
ncbi:hypothetical protein DRI50_11220 [candidate division KSB1 bacterium]|nr:MAG: hypothetical protein DRI50_11220 [candidate division KSB1 bacterium]